eukprot:s16_g53.t1
MATGIFVTDTDAAESGEGMTQPPEDDAVAASSSEGAIGAYACQSECEESLVFAQAQDPHFDTAKIAIYPANSSSSQTHQGYMQADQQTWPSYSGEQWPQQSAKSPRAKTRRRSRRGRAQQQQPQVPQQAQEKLLAPPMPPPLTGPSGQMEAPWINFAAPVAATSTEASSSSHAEKALKELATAIKQNPETVNTLTPRAQTLVKESLVKAGRAETKDMHSVVTEMGKAKEQLEGAVLERSQMIASWHAFLNHSIELWKQYVVLFQQQEATLMERIRAAQENFSNVKESFENRKEALNDNVIHIEDDVADQAMADASAAASHKIRAGLEGMQSTLSQLAAEAATEVKQHHKRQRTAEESDVPLGVSSKPGAMDPFGGGGNA